MPQDRTTLLKAPVSLLFTENKSYLIAQELPWHCKHQVCPSLTPGKPWKGLKDFLRERTRMEPPDCWPDGFPASPQGENVGIANKLRMDISATLCTTWSDIPCLSPLATRLAPQQVSWLSLWKPWSSWAAPPRQDQNCHKSLLSKVHGPCHAWLHTLMCSKSCLWCPCCYIWGLF